MHSRALVCAHAESASSSRRTDSLAIAPSLTLVAPAAPRCRMRRCRKREVKEVKGVKEGKGTSGAPPIRNTAPSSDSEELERAPATMPPEFEVRVEGCRVLGEGGDGRAQEVWEGSGTREPGSDGLRTKACPPLTSSPFPPLTCQPSLTTHHLPPCRISSGLRQHIPGRIVRPRPHHHQSRVPTRRCVPRRSTQEFPAVTHRHGRNGTRSSFVLGAGAPRMYVWYRGGYGGAAPGPHATAS